MKTIVLVMVFVPLAAITGFGCDMDYSILGPDGITRAISPERPVRLEAETAYELVVLFTEEHRNCTLPAEDTIFRLNGIDWEQSAPGAGLSLSSEIRWLEDGARSYIARIQFTSAATGNFELEVIRDCNKKEGYDETLLFRIT